MVHDKGDKAPTKSCSGLESSASVLHSERTRPFLSWGFSTRVRKREKERGGFLCSHVSVLA